MILLCLTHVGGIAQGKSPQSNVAKLSPIR